jgi:hypothetical protein
VDDFTQPGDCAVALARAACEAIRGLNHATRRNDGLGRPSAAVFLSDAQLSAAGLGGDLDAAQQQLAFLHSRARQETP